jgi:hypothetical protein
MVRTPAPELVKKHLADLSDDELREVRDQINDYLMDDMDTKLSSADPSADDEKKKYIAQHGSNPNAQTSAQNVPQPSSDEVKELQNEKAHDEHMARGQVEQGDEVTARERGKLKTS